MNDQIRQAVLDSIAARDRIQSRFMHAVLVKLAHIESQVTMIHGAQIATACPPGNLSTGELEKRAHGAEEFMSKKSRKAFFKMVEYVFTEPESKPPKTKKSKRRSV